MATFNIAVPTTKGPMPGVGSSSCATVQALRTFKLGMGSGGATGVVIGDQVRLHGSMDGLDFRPLRVDDADVILSALEFSKTFQDESVYYAAERMSVGSGSTLAFVQMHAEDIAIPSATDPVDLADGTSVQINRQGRLTWVRLPASTLSANGSAILPPVANALPGDVVILTRLDTGAYTYAVKDSGSGTATLVTLVASKVNSAQFVMNAAGTHWQLQLCGTQ